MKEWLEKAETREDWPIEAGRMSATGARYRELGQQEKVGLGTRVGLSTDLARGRAGVEKMHASVD